VVTLQVITIYVLYIYILYFYQEGLDVQMANTGKNVNKYLILKKKDGKK